jgi:hypothetical protein
MSPPLTRGGKIVVRASQVPPMRIGQHDAGATCVMSDIHTLALRQADQARTDFAAIESELEVIQKQLGRLPTRRGVSEDRSRASSSRR